MKFIYSFIATVIVFLVSTAGISTLAIQNGVVDLPYAQLYAYQRSKVDSLKSTDLLFIGDSSLGNAIDVRLCTSEYNITCTSLALTGAFGYGGSLGMLERALNRTTPKAVIVFQTLDMMSRGVSSKAYSLISPKKSKVLFSNFEDTASTLWNFNYVKVAFKKGLKGAVPPTDMVARDYIVQLNNLSLKPEPVVPEWKKTASPKKIKYLKEIVTLCKEENIPLLYVYGPLAAPSYRGAHKFKSESDALIAATGITMAKGTPFIIPWKEVGDSSDHVNPVFRKKFTRMYLNKILEESHIKKAFQYPVLE